MCCSVSSLRFVSFQLDLVDRMGEVHRLQLIGIDKISTNPGPVNLDAAYDMFPHVERGDIDRPAGSVGILIGQEAVKLLPSRGDDPRDINGNLRIMRMRFRIRSSAGRFTPRYSC